MQNRIKEFIIKSGMTQVEVAARAGMTKIALSQIIKVKMPRLETIDKIAAILGIPAWKLCLSDSDYAEIAESLAENKTREEEAAAADAATCSAKEFTCPICGGALSVSAKG